jgi:SAM-dependent methyltransferase
MSEAAHELARAYAGVEEMDSFEDTKALRDYRESVLARSGPQADFLLEHLPASASVLEVACGNGRLLIELAERGVLSEGTGFDIAASRIEFASRWAQDARHSMLRFEVADVFETELGQERYDTAICITGAFGYFEPIEAGSALRLARKLHSALRPRGLLCLELYPSPRYRRLAEAAGGEVRVWTELPPEDPWRFYLSHLALEGPVLVHNKTFVHRHTGEVDAGRVERLYLYSPRDIEELLGEADFEGVTVHEGWTREAYRGGESMVVVARRPVA